MITASQKKHTQYSSIAPPIRKKAEPLRPYERQYYSVCVCACVCWRGGEGGKGHSLLFLCATAAKSRECTILVIAAMSCRYDILQCSMTMAKAHYARNEVIIVLPA